MTSWKFVGCSIGRSAGHAPFRILSTIPSSRHLHRMLAACCNRPRRASDQRNELPFDHLIYRRTGNLRAVELMLGHTRIEVRLATSASRSMMPSILQRRSRSELPGQSCRALLAGGYGQKVPNQTFGRGSIQLGSLALTQQSGTRLASDAGPAALKVRRVPGTAVEFNPSSRSDDFGGSARCC